MNRFELYDNMQSQDYFELYDFAISKRPVVCFINYDYITMDKLERDVCVLELKQGKLVFKSRGMIYTSVNIGNPNSFVEICKAYAVSFIHPEHNRILNHPQQKKFNKPKTLK